MANTRTKKGKLTADDFRETIFAPDGKEFTLPDQLREYEELDPVGAAKYADKLQQKYINAGYDPELDPDSPQFNKERYLAEFDKIKEHLSQMTETYAVDLAEVLQSALDVIISVNDTLPAKNEAINQKIAGLIDILANNADKFSNSLDEYISLLPYIKEELKKPQYYGGCTLDEFTRRKCQNEEEEKEKNRLWDQARAAAIAAQKKSDLPTTAIKRAGFVEYPLDKPNSQIWNLLEKDTQAQITFAAEKAHSKKPIDIYYSIDFSALESSEGVAITKRLTPFDKRTYIAISALFNAGNNIITLTQIYYAMGNIGRPSKTQLEKINNAISKMMSARIFVDNSKEAAAYKYTKFVYDGSLLPLERGTAVVNGQLADAAIHIFREPPMITFAKQRKQITTLDVKLLQSPFNKTDANLLIDDYLLERISRAKNGKQPKKILFKTLYEKTDITTAKQRARAAEKITGYLDYYKKCGFIRSYTLEKDGVTISF